MLRKGTTSPDGTYTYTCGCGYQDSACAYCYGGNLEKCQEAIKTARGQVYYGLLKTILSHVGKQMVDEAKQIGKDKGIFSWFDLGYVSLKYKLNFKATAEWLGETGVINSGCYERFIEGKGKVKGVYAAVRERHPDL